MIYGFLNLQDYPTKLISPAVMIAQLDYSMTQYTQQHGEFGKRELDRPEGWVWHGKRVIFW